MINVASTYCDRYALGKRIISLHLQYGAVKLLPCDYLKATQILSYKRDDPSHFNGHQILHRTPPRIHTAILSMNLPTINQLLLWPLILTLPRPRPVLRYWHPHHLPHKTAGPCTQGSWALHLESSGLISPAAACSYDGALNLE